MTFATTAHAAPDDILVDEDFSADLLPDGWDPILGDWHVNDGQLEASSGTERTRIAFGPEAPENYKLELAAKFLAADNEKRWLNVGLDYHSDDDWGAVLVLRQGTSASTGIELAQKPDVDGSWTSSPTGPASVDFDLETQRDVVIEVRGQNMTVEIDGNEEFSATNLNRTGGGFAFVINRSTVQFDNVRLTELGPEATASSQPKNFQAEALEDSVNLTWSAPDNPGTEEDGSPAQITGYEVAIGEPGTPPNDLNWNSADSDSQHTFSGVSSNKVHQVYVRAINSGGKTSAAASVVTLGADRVGKFKLEHHSGPWPTSHVQGITVDQENEYIYYSFTTMLIKTDFAGNLIGTVGGFTGHLGDISFNPDDGRVYGSLEYKEDEAFYIAIFDVDEIDEEDIDGQDSDVLTTVYLPQVVEDYTADMDGDGEFDGNTGNTEDHRYGNSGIDGTSFGPKFGSTDEDSLYLTVAAGIYENKERTDNDHQVLYQYDVSDWPEYERPLNQADPHDSGPEEIDGKYFVYTGNTRYGVQNLKYDPWLEKWFMSVYTGSKPEFPNYKLFAVDAESTPKEEPLEGVFGHENYDPADQVGLVLPLSNAGLYDPDTGIRGWHGGPTEGVGIQPLGDSLYYISKGGGSSNAQTSDLTLYTWTGHADNPFAKVGSDFKIPEDVVIGDHSFADVDENHSFNEAIYWLASNGITTGYPDGTFRPNNKITREAMAAMLYRAAGKPEFEVPDVSPFDDVSTADGFYAEITWVHDSGVTTGYSDGTFRPQNEITREAMAAFIFRQYS